LRRPSGGTRAVFGLSPVAKQYRDPIGLLLRVGVVEGGDQPLGLSAFRVARMTQHDLERVVNGADRLVGMERQVDRRMDR
jgi:hypothetical protein